MRGMGEEDNGWLMSSSVEAGKTFAEAGGELAGSGDVPDTRHECLHLGRVARTCAGRCIRPRHEGLATRPSFCSDAGEVDERLFRIGNGLRITGYPSCADSQKLR